MPLRSFRSGWSDRAWLLGWAWLGWAWSVWLIDLIGLVCFSDFVSCFFLFFLVVVFVSSPPPNLTCFFVYFVLFFYLPVYLSAFQFVAVYV